MRRPSSSAKPQEIERKFLVPDPPAALLAAHPGELLAQGYLTVGGEGAPAEVRVRRQGNGSAVLTVKSAGGGEVDIYAGPLAGLVVAEVEFPDLAAALCFQAPAWFGREVTEDSAFRNAALARAGWSPD